jgi:hypothetical protein
VPWIHRSFWLGPLIIGAILAVLFLLFSRGRLHKIYTERFQETRRERLFLAPSAFLSLRWLFAESRLRFTTILGLFTMSPCMAGIFITWCGAFCCF